MGVTGEMGLVTGVGLILLLITEINPSPSLSSDLWNMRLEYDEKGHKPKDDTIDDPKDIETAAPDTEAEETILNWNFEDDMSVENEESNDELKTDPPGGQESQGDLGFQTYFDVGAVEVESEAKETTRKPWTLHRDEEFLRKWREMGQGRRQVSRDGGSHSSNGGSHSPNGGSHSPNGWEVRVGTDISVNM